MKCEACNKEHDGSYGSGRFCCQACSRSFATKSKRKEINQKISEALKGKPTNITEKVIEGRNKRKQKTLSKKLDKQVYVNGDVINITNRELEEYRKTHLVCEICGQAEHAITFTGYTNRTEPNKLCIDHDHDHDHNTKEFRGLLCVSCNSKLGWYQNNKEAIEKYLSKSS